MADKPAGMMDLLNSMPDGPQPTVSMETIKGKPAEPQKEKPQESPKETAPVEEKKEAPAIPDDISSALTGEKVEEKKPETEDALTEEQINKAPKHQREALVQTNKLIRELRRESRDLKTQLEEAKKAAPTQELTKLQEELKLARQSLEEKERALTVADLTQTDQFKSAILQPLHDLGSRVDSIATKYKANTKDILAAFQKADEGERNTALKEIASEFDEPDRMKLYTLGDKFSEIEAKKQQLLKAPQETMSAIRERREKEQVAARENMKKQWTEALASSKENIGKNNPYYRKIEGNDAWNKQIDDIERFVSETDLSTSTASDLAVMLRQSALLPLANRLAAFYAKENADLKKRLGNQRAADPSVGSTPKGEVKNGKDSRGFMEFAGL